MNYVFDSNVAVVVGVDGAVMLQNINYWIAKNKANNKHFYDESYWTYNSISAFEQLFPFWSKKQLSRILKSLIDNGYLADGNYNKQNYDRTKWYTITQKGYSILPNGEMDFAKKDNGNAQKVQPIPNINTDNKPNNKYTSNDVEDIWNMYPNKKGKDKAIAKIPKILESYGKEQLIEVIERYCLEVQNVDKQFILHGSTFFNGRFKDYLDENYKATLVADVKCDTDKSKTVEIDKSKLGAL